MNDEPEFEELEQIPWSALAARSAPSLLRPLTIAAAVVVVIALIGGLALRITSSDPADPGVGPVTLPQLAGDTPSETAATPVTSPVVPTDDVVATGPDAGDVAVYSEADLMAISVADEERLAAAYGEWFVQDYFTIDGDQEIAETLDRLVIAEAALPHQNPVGSSYVEWARAVAVTSPRPAEYSVDVAFRTLFSVGGEEFARAPVRAVTVAVAVDVGGAVTVVGLPAPAALPALGWDAGTTGAAAVAPDAVVAEAMSTTEAFGLEPAVVAASRDGSTWHLVVEVGDASGNRWPLAVSVGDA